MMKSERARKDRMWLKMHKFAITASLQAKLAASDLSLEEQEWCCYIQHKMLYECQKKALAEVPVSYFKAKMGWGYKRYIQKLKDWGELKVDNHFIMPSAFIAGESKHYWIPLAAQQSGILVHDFKVERIRATKDASKYSPAEPWIHFIHDNLKQLSSRKELVEFQSPVDIAASQDWARKVFDQEFNCGVGKLSKRLSHSVISMPREYRANLVWRDTNLPLEVEWDVKSCHPVLLLLLATDDTERQNYIRVLDHDIYNVIRVDGEIEDARDGCKDQWFWFVNNPEKSHERCKKNYVYQFYRKYFPKLTEAILHHQGTARYLQKVEASIMVAQLGAYCMAQNIWYVPMHDGFLCKDENALVVRNYVAECFSKLTGYQVFISYKPFIPSNIDTLYTHHHHMWGYKTPVQPNSEWEKRLVEYKKRYPEAELEELYKKRELVNQFKKQKVKEQKESKELGRALAKYHTKI